MISHAGKAKLEAQQSLGYISEVLYFVAFLWSKERLLQLVKILVREISLNCLNTPDNSTTNIAMGHHTEVPGRKISFFNLAVSSDDLPLDISSNSRRLCSP